MTEHTPGPWVKFGDEVYGADGTRIAEAVSVRDMPAILAVPEIMDRLFRLLGTLDQFASEDPGHWRSGFGDGKREGFRYCARALREALGLPA